MIELQSIQEDITAVEDLIKTSKKERESMMAAIKKIQTTQYEPLKESLDAERMEKGLSRLPSLQEENEKQMAEYLAKRQQNWKSQTSSTSRKYIPLRKALGTMLNQIIKKDSFDLFYEPVKAEEVPDYYAVIKQPMCFATMKQKLRTDAYNTLEMFQQDVSLICENSMKYNGEDTHYYQQAKKLLAEASEIIQSYTDKIDPMKLSNWS